MKHCYRKWRPTAFRTLLTDVTDYIDRAPRGAALETLQKFGVPSGTLFSNYLRSFRAVVASTVDKGGLLAPSPEIAIELIRIRTAQQYPMLMPTLFPGILATRERPCDSLATLWTVFAHLKHNTSPAIDGDAFSPAHKGLSSYTHHAATSSNSPTTSPNRSTRHFGRQDTASGVFNISPTHSRRDPFADDYGLWPFDDRDYDIVCTVTNHILNANLSLWTPLLSEEARRQYSTRVAAVTAAQPSIAFAGARPPSEIHSHSLTPSLERTILMDLSLKHGNYA